MMIMGAVGGVGVDMEVVWIPRGIRMITTEVVVGRRRLGVDVEMVLCFGHG